MPTAQRPILTGPIRPSEKTVKKRPKAASSPGGIAYQVYPEPTTNSYRVVCRIDKPTPAGQTIRWPAWIPGSYRIRDFAKQVVEISADRKGKKIDLVKLDKQTWRIGPCRGPLTVVTRIYAGDSSVRGAWLSASHGFFNAVCLFFRIDGQDASPVMIDIHRPTEEFARYWQIATVLPRRGDVTDGFGRFEAANYETLIDVFFALGLFQTTSFEAFGVPHKVVVSGAHGQIDLDRLALDCRRLCETQLGFFGPPYPISNYLFFLQMADGVSGLEHRSCSALQCRRENLPMANRKPGGPYVALLRLMSHEYFHLWLVKRIKPVEVAESDLRSEAHSRQLWIFEGLTAYYENLLLLRAKLISEAEFLQLIAKEILILETTPGRQVQSVAESSFDAWTKLYHADEIAPYGMVSYYLKGAVIGLCLDLLIRGKSAGRSSLDEVMRALWRQSGRPEIPIAEGDFETLCETVTGCRLKSRLKRWVYGVGDLPVETLLGTMAIRMARHYRSLPDLGMTVVEAGCLLKIVSIAHGGPAQRAGLMAGDEIVAVEACRMNRKRFDLWLETVSVGDLIEIAFIRDDKLSQTGLVAGAPIIDAIGLTALDGPRHREAVKRRTHWFSPRPIRKPLSFA